MHRTGLFLLAATASVALAACTGGSPIVTQTPTAGVTGTPSASSSASPTPSPTGPLTDEQLLEILPEAATRQDSEGAIATAKFFLEEYQRIYETGDTRVWEALSRPDCGFCAGVVDNVNELHAAGGHREGGYFTFDLSNVQVGRNPDNGYFYVGFDVSWSATEDHYPDGSIVPDGPGKSGFVTIEMLENGAFWQIRGLATDVDD